MALTAASARIERCVRLGGVRYGPPLEVQLLVEHLAGGEQPVGDRLGDRATVAARRSVEGRADLDAAGLGPGGEPVDVLDDLGGGRGGTRRHEVGEVAGDVGSQPRCRLLLNEAQRLADQHVLVHGGRSSPSGDAVCGQP